MQIEPTRIDHNSVMPTERRKVLTPVVCLLSGVVILFAAWWLVDTRAIHLYGVLNDQVAYINAGRSLATRGTLESNSIFPSTLWQKKNRTFLHMPGHPFSLAASFALFGFGPFQSIIPSLISYLIAMLAIYLIGARLYSRTVGLIAGLMFALFPPILFFAYTAMAELTTLAVFTVAVCVCLYLPPRLQPWLGPVLCAVPFLFRETTAFIVPALGLYFWLDRRDKLAWRSLVFVAISVVLLGAIYRADFSSQRPSLWHASLLAKGDVIYTDAVAQQHLSKTSWRETLRVLPKRVVINARAIFDTSGDAPFEDLGRYILIATMVFVALIAFLFGDKLAISLSAFNLIAVVAQSTLYKFAGFVGLRCLLFTYALGVVVIASMLAKALSSVRSCGPMLVAVARVNRGEGLIMQISVILLAACLFILSLGIFRSMHVYFSDRDAFVRSPEVLLESLNHDDTKMLVAPVQLSVWYNYEHFPVVWSFPPQNEATLALLASRFDIGTLIVDAKHPLLKDPTALDAWGFYIARDFSLGSVKYFVYRRLPQAEKVHKN